MYFLNQTKIENLDYKHVLDLLNLKKAQQNNLKKKKIPTYPT
jgi:hypothetical protein